MDTFNRILLLCYSVVYYFCLHSLKNLQDNQTVHLFIYLRHTWLQILAKKFGVTKHKTKAIIMQYDLILKRCRKMLLFT